MHKSTSQQNIVRASSSVKPSWDSTTSDQSKYRLNEKELLKKKINYMSKNAVLARQEFKLKKLGVKQPAEVQQVEPLLPGRSVSSCKEGHMYPGTPNTDRSEDKKQHGKKQNSNRTLFGTSKRFYQEVPRPDPKQKYPRKIQEEITAKVNPQEPTIENKTSL